MTLEALFAVAGQVLGLFAGMSSQAAVTLGGQVLAFAVVLAAPASLLRREVEGRRWRRPGFWATVITCGYVIYFIAANLYWGVYWGWIPAGNRYVMAVKIYTLHLHLLLVLTLAAWLYDAITRRRHKHDLQSLLALAILLAAELLGALQYVVCKLPEPDARIAAKTLGQIAPEYVCSWASSWFTPAAVPIITTITLAAANQQLWKFLSSSTALRRWWRHPWR